MCLDWVLADFVDCRKERGIGIVRKGEAMCCYHFRRFGPWGFEGKWAMSVEGEVGCSAG